ncbi:MAG: hypothetical protein KGL39_49140 [Patescibacteria group bacterium]|nr:hypothetical protein [Patescibacteria group bacterium]
MATPEEIRAINDMFGTDYDENDPDPGQGYTGHEGYPDADTLAEYRAASPYDDDGNLKKKEEPNNPVVAKTRQNARRTTKVAALLGVPAVALNAARGDVEQPQWALTKDGRRVYTLFVPGMPPSLNGGTRHWGTRYRIGNEFKYLAGWQAKVIRRGLPLEHAKVTCTLVRVGGLAKDVDNAYTSIKPIVDGIKGILIVDDSTAHIELLVNQERGKTRGVRIVVEEVKKGSGDGDD